jgi:N-acetylmuramoyl-L-alanine amidase
LGEWKNYSEAKINDDYALLKKSTIPCMMSGKDIKIVDSGQTATITDLDPIVSPTLVTQIWGRDKAEPCEKVPYKVIAYSNPPKPSERASVKWAVKVDGGEIELLPQYTGETITLEIKQEWAGKEITLMAYLTKPLETEKAYIEIDVKKLKPVIIIDPGHGVEAPNANEGAQARIYKYKIKGKDEKVLLDDKGNIVTRKKENVMELPDYVLDNPAEWIIGDNSSPKYDHVHGFDAERTEYHLTYDIAKIMYDYFKAKGYNVINTRTSRDVIVLNTPDLPRRVDIANNNKADYFISIHADGVDGFSTGAHAMYSSIHDIKEGKELASDMLKYYTVVKVVNSPRKDERNLYIFKNDNKTKRITIVEVGFLSNPKEAKILFSNINLIAIQLIQGLEKNIKKNF